MRMEDVITDHELDARDNGDGSYTSVCPHCMSMGMLQIDMRAQRYRCHSCGSAGGPYELWSRVNKRRNDRRMH